MNGVGVGGWGREGKEIKCMEEGEALNFPALPRRNTQ